MSDEHTTSQVFRRSAKIYDRSEDVRKSLLRLPCLCKNSEMPISRTSRNQDFEKIGVKLQQASILKDISTDLLIVYEHFSQMGV